MASSLTSTTFTVNETQEITGIKTVVNDSNTEVPTSKAVKDFIDNMIPVSLTVSGGWGNYQFISEAVDTTGLTFTVTYKNGITASVIPNVSPTKWSSTVGTQTATFYYTESGVTVSASKSASVDDPSILLIPFTLYAREAGNVSIRKVGNPGTIYYSKNGGSQTELPSDTNVSVVNGDRVSFYRTLSSNLSTSNYFYISCTNNCYVYGNVMSLYNKDNFANLTTIEYDYSFYNLFNSNNQYIDINESVGKLLLPATTLANYCYHYMFAGCRSLTISPILPATTLAEGCYKGMFYSCINLTTAPYILPATTLAKDCYYTMFPNCENLTNTPTLPATTLVEGCYSTMFLGCENITSITCLATDISATNCTRGWTGAIFSSGTFITLPSTPWTTGSSGIPTNWTRVNA